MKQRMRRDLLMEACARDENCTRACVRYERCTGVARTHPAQPVDEPRRLRARLSYAKD